MAGDSEKNFDSPKGGVIAHLHPSFMDELKFGQFKDSLSLSGSYRMNLRQPSRQPEHSRYYQHGDPVKLIDWKAYAKHDQLIIREIQDDASAKAAIIIDYSDTMLWPDAKFASKQNVTTKIECAVRAAMSICYAHLKGGDYVDLIFMQENELRYIFHPRSSTDIVVSFDRISRSEFQKEKLFLECQPMTSWQKNYDRVYMVSDLLDDSFSHQWNFNFPEAKMVTVYHLLSHLENEIDWIEAGAFYHEQSSQGRSLKKEYQGKTLLQGSGYVHELKKWKSKIKEEFSRRAFNYYEISDLTAVQSFMLTL